MFRLDVFRALWTLFYVIRLRLLGGAGGGGFVARDGGGGGGFFFVIVNGFAAPLPRDVAEEKDRSPNDRSELLAK